MKPIPIDPLLSRAASMRRQLDDLLDGVRSAAYAENWGEAERLASQATGLAARSYAPLVRSIRERTGEAWLSRQQAHLEDPPKLHALYDDESVELDEFLTVLYRYEALWDVVAGNPVDDTLERIGDYMARKPRPDAPRAQVTLL